MRPVKLIPLIAWLMSSTAAHAEQPPATLELLQGSDPAVLLRSIDPTRTVSMPACRGLVWEVLDLERGLFAPLTPEPCPPSQVAQTVDDTGIASRPPQPPFYPASLRAVALVGVNCSPQRPFSIADCEETFTLTSSAVTFQTPQP
jgi:hypothetical protein